MILLRILRPFGLWNAGETASFPPERAAEIIASGYGESVAAEPAAEAPAAAEPAKRRKG